jgi:hypothetical protein
MRHFSAICACMVYVSFFIVSYNIFYHLTSHIVDVLICLHSHTDRLMYADENERKKEIEGAELSKCNSTT